MMFMKRREKTHSVILLYWCNEVLCEVIEENIIVKL